MTQTAIGRPGAIAFDLDGTLVDSLPDMTRALNRVIEELGRAAVAPSAVRNWVGDGVAVLVERAFQNTGGVPAGMSVADGAARFRHFYSGHAAEQTRLFPGVEAALVRFKADGFRLGVCTNKPYALAMEVLEGMGIAPLFDAVVGGDSLTVHKPDAGHLTGTLAAMGADGAPALMVGDSVNDVATARAAGVPVAVASFGYSRVPANALGADLVFDDFVRLPELARRFFPV